MAGAGATGAPPQALAPSPGPPARRGAGAAAPRRRLELAADAMLCCFTGAIVVGNASGAACIAARGAFGRGSRAAAFAGELFMKSFLASALLFLLAVLAQKLVDLFGDRNEARVAPRWWQVGGGGAALRRLVTAPIFSLSFMCMAVGLLTLILAPAKESYLASVGYMVGDVGCFLYSVAFCFVFYRELLVQLRSIYAKLKED